MHHPADPDPVVDMPAELARVRAATYTGRDPENLVTAIVDADGVVVRIAFASTVGMRPLSVLERAVVVAVEAAQQQMNDAWHALARRVPTTVEPEETP
jgi:hypothetical protein